VILGDFVRFLAFLDNLGGCGDFDELKTNLLLELDQKRFKIIQKQLKTVNLT
jgi:hypothetical protein